MRYRIFCETENDWVESESLLISDKCPNDSLHTTISSSLVIIESSEEYIFNNNNKGYRKLRRELISYVTNNYQTMTQDELRQASEHFATPKEVRDMFFTMEEQIRLGDIFNKRACADRHSRQEMVMSILMNRLSYSETLEIINDLMSNNLISKYVDLGVEGTSEGDPDGVFDYFTSKVGTSFENTGFMSKAFTPIGDITIAQLSQDIMNILKVS